MSEAALPTAAPAKPRLSTPQMLQLMRLEVDKALRHAYPISCMVIGLDGFDDLSQVEARRALMPELFRELKRVTFENDVRGLGIFTERYELGLFPHVDPTKLEELAEEMLVRGRGLTPPDGCGAETVTLSIGISHNLHPGEMSFEILVEEAESGMLLSRSGGGDRYVQAKEVESEVDRLREELDDQIAELEEQQSQIFGDSSQETWGKRLTQKALELFEREPDQSEGVLRLEKEVIALIKAEIQAWRDTSSVAQMLESQRQVELLERRVRKLTESLGVTEQELKRVAAAKNIDLGVSSIYRTVQGLGADDGLFEQKKEMLKGIFEANLLLQGKSAS